MQNSEVVQKLKELGKEIGEEKLVFLNGHGGGGWFVADARRVTTAELREMGLPSKTLGVALVEDSEKENLMLNALVKKLGKYADSAVIYAEIGPLENPLLQVCSIRAGTPAEHWVVNVRTKNVIIVSAE
jgi:hypothetical protein